MRARTRLALDAALLVAFIAAYRPAWTGLTVHQWLSIVIVAPLLVHGVVNWEWTLRVVRTFFERLMHMSRLNLVIDAALFVSAVCVMVSGVMVSPMLLSALGVHTAQSPVWHVVHAWSANATIAMLGVHGIVHWRWLYRTAAKLAAAPAQGATGPAVAATGRVATRAPRQDQPVGRGARRTSRVGSRAAQAASERAMALRAISVAGVTGLVGLTVFVGVSVASPSLVGSRQGNGKVASISGTVCPSTGCTASKCHAQYGQSAKTFYGLGSAKPKPRRNLAGSTTGTRVATASKRPSAVNRAKAASASARSASKRVAAAPAAKPKAAKAKPAKAKRAVAVKPKVRVQTCPQTGCTASSCHGAHGVSASKWYKTH